MLLRLRSIPRLEVSENVPLADCTRFRIGGRADVLADAPTEAALLSAIQLLNREGAPYTVIGGGSNLIAADDGFRGVVLRYTNASIEVLPKEASAPLHQAVRVAAGAVLQDLVDLTISEGLAGLETLTGIPGWVGGAVYGNAGAYGHSIQERVRSVRYTDGASVRGLTNAECQFRYRESIFKKHKERIILSTDLVLTPAAAEGLRETATGIRKIRDEKYPPTMRCAGSIFKNLILSELPDQARAQIPEKVIREGKVPSAYFLEQTGAKGMARGGVKVASYHANLIYNEGTGTALELRELIADLKQRVHERFGIELEEEVQYI